MNSGEFTRSERLFHELIGLEPDERAVLLAEITAEDPTLGAELRALLAAHEEDGELERLQAAMDPAAAGGPGPGPGSGDTAPGSRAGTRIGPYEIADLIGRGGMGEVYRARDTKLGRDVALKFLPPWLAGNPTSRDRFLVEARSASAIDHTNVCALFDMKETEEGGLYLVMPYYAGRTLRERLTEGPVGAEEALGIALQAARGLAAAHERGVIHRDVKPGNLLLTEKGQVKILDFGIAKLGDAALTRTGESPGTASYMSPEQRAGERVDARTDLWSLGAVLFEMLTGRRVAGRASIPEGLAGVPRALADVVTRLLAESPVERYPDAKSLVEDLSVLAAGGRTLTAGEAPGWQRFFAELKRRHVFRVAAVYGAVGFAVIEASQAIFPNVGLPETAVRLVVWLVLLGLPVALVLAWALELAPGGGIRRTREVRPAILDAIAAQPVGRRWPIGLAGAAGGALLVAAAWLALGSIGGSRAAESTTNRSPEDGVDQKSIAVLPFVTLDSANVGFAEGISDELRHTLGKLREIRVAAATSALALQTSARSAREIGETLHVTHLLDGSVRASGDSVRITTWLVDAGTDTQIWSGTYTRPFENVFAIQDEIAASVVRELEVRLLDSLPETRRTHPETYRLYLQAQYLLRTGSHVDKQAEELLTRAREYDATYVPAILLLARVYHRMAFDRPDPYRRLTRALVDRALELEPDNGFAHGWRGWLALFFDGDLETAARAEEMSFRLDPSNVDNLHGLQQVSRVFGRPDLAVAFGRYEVILDPVCARCYYQLGRSYLAAGDLDPAEDALRTAERLDPNSDDIDPQIDLGIVQLLRGDPSAALSEFERLSNDNPNRTVGLALASHSLGLAAEYAAAVDALATRADSARWLAPVYAWAGDADAAFAAIRQNRAAGRPTYRFESVHVDPIYRHLHEDPRWETMLRQRGVAPDQLAEIDFDPEFPPVVTDALENAGFSTDGLRRPSG